MALNSVATVGAGLEVGAVPSEVEGFFYMDFFTQPNQV